METLNTGNTSKNSQSSGNSITNFDRDFSAKARKRMFIEDVKNCIERMRSAKPLTHCVTNNIVQELTSNVLLAAGATPIMVCDPEETEQLAQIASGVLVNVGTFRKNYTDTSINAAIRGCKKSGTPWVLDPVGVGLEALTSRINFVKNIITENPTVIRANAAEILALAGEKGDMRGVDSLDSVNSALPAARKLAKQHGSVVAISGEQDAIYAHGCLARVSGGSEIMQKVVGTGCALGALVAAYVGTNPSCPLAATVAAHAHAAAAGSYACSENAGINAGINAKGNAEINPGTFRTLWIDALSKLSADEILNLASIDFTVEPVDWTLYLVTDPRMGNRTEEEVALESIEGGVTVVQLRDKYSDDDVISKKALKMRETLINAGHGDVPIFIDDHVACAAKLGFNLHVGQKDTPFVEARKALPAEWMMGLSCARPDLMEKVYRECKESDMPLPDVIGIGAAFTTHTKAHDVPPLGVDGVNEVAKVAHAAGVKTLAIGGIHENTVFPIRGLELDGVCTVSALMCAEKPGEVAAELKSVITR